MVVWRSDCVTNSCVFESGYGHDITSVSLLQLYLSCSETLNDLRDLDMLLWRAVSVERVHAVTNFHNSFLNATDQHAPEILATFGLCD